MEPIAVGDILAGKYAIRRRVADGGGGVVFEAKHLQLLERRAIKLLRFDACIDVLARERFMREARALARLTSDHVVKVFDIGQLDDETPYMVMEYLEGADLDETIERRGPLPAAEAALYVLQVCAALAEAHAIGLVHRDIKPSNVFLARVTGGAHRVKLIDFGIAKALGVPTSEALKTQEGALLGSPHFMAPEQIDSRAIDERTDIWALGVTLYQLLTAHLPFEDATISTMLTHILLRPPTPPARHLPSIPPALEQIILACLEKRPSDRPASVAVVAAALAPFTSEGASLSEHVQRVLQGAADRRSSPAETSAMILLRARPFVASPPALSTASVFTPPALEPAEIIEARRRVDPTVDGSLAGPASSDPLRAAFASSSMAAPSSDSAPPRSSPRRPSGRWLAPAMLVAATGALVVMILPGLLHRPSSLPIAAAAADPEPPSPPVSEAQPPPPSPSASAEVRPAPDPAATSSTRAVRVLPPRATSHVPPSAGFDLRNRH